MDPTLCSGIITLTIVYLPCLALLLSIYLDLAFPCDADSTALMLLEDSSTALFRRSEIFSTRRPGRQCTDNKATHPLNVLSPNRPRLDAGYQLQCRLQRTILDPHVKVAGERPQIDLPWMLPIATACHRVPAATRWRRFRKRADLPPRDGHTPHDSPTRFREELGLSVRVKSDRISTLIQSCLIKRNLMRCRRFSRGRKGGLQSRQRQMSTTLWLGFLVFRESLAAMVDRTAKCSINDITISMKGDRTVQIVADLWDEGGMCTDC